LKKRLIVLIALILSPLLIYLMYPLDDRRYAITADRAMLERKRAFLDARRTCAHARNRPNIVIILADDLGKTDISLYGGTAVHTPNIDALGKEGVVFDEAYCTSPICSPSRAGMLTGRYGQRYGYETQPNSRYPRNRLEYYAYKNFVNTGNWVLAPLQGIPAEEDIARQGLPASEITLAELLGADGYRTAITGKWHLGHNGDFIPNNRGFGYQYGFYEAFTLYAPIGSPGIVEHRHDYFASKHIWAQERTGTCAIRRDGAVIDEKEYLTFAIAREAVQFIKENSAAPFLLYVPFSAPHTPFQAPVSYCERFSHVADTNKRVYYAMIAALDDAVGMISRAIKDAGLDEKTLVVFASDNGGATYTGATDNAPLKGGKFTNFEGGINVPLALRWKGRISGGARYTKPVSLLDVFATAASAAGCALPSDREIDGVDLLPYVTGSAKCSPHRALFWRSCFNRAVRKGDWKLIVDERSGRKLLYNMRADKVEHRDLSAGNPETIEELMNHFRAWEKGMTGPLWPRVMDYRFVIDGEEFYYAL